MNKKLYLVLISCIAFFAAGIQNANACNANFTYIGACAGDTVFFNAFDQYAVYTWDFGDSASSDNISHDTDAYHIFVNPGTYMVTLFVNIGAEWAYQTQIITIGTDCFDADFSYNCMGSGYINFTNHSVGDNLTYIWDFGDPGSSDNSSTISDPMHLFSGFGDFTVSLIIFDGTNYDTAIQTVHVDTNCINMTIYNNISGNCMQDSTYLTPYCYGSVNSYLWDFGDPGSGSANTSTDSIGIHQYTAPGLYLVTLIVSDGIQTDTFYTVQDIIDCTVWPGNLNRDGQVDMEDLFALGIYFGDVGITRLSPSLNWTGQQAPDWMSGLGYDGMMYLQDFVDKKNADADGNGSIDQLDLAAISLNYGRTVPGYHHNDRMAPVTVRPIDPVLQILTGTGTVTAGDTVHLPIDLSAIAYPHDIYGIAAKIYYDVNAIVPGSISVTFDNSWFGVDGADMLTLYKDNPIGGYIEFGMVKTLKMKVSGAGQIAVLNFIVNPSAHGNMSLRIDPVVKMISNGMYSSNNQEIFSPVQVNSGNILAITAGVNELKSSLLSVYPNPASEYVNVQLSNNDRISTYTISNAIGQIVVSQSVDKKSNTVLIPVSSLSAGVYQIKVTGDAGIYTKDLLIGE